MAVYLSTTNPAVELEEVEADKVFLIRGPVDETSGKVIYYLTRALDAYAVPDPESGLVGQTIEEYFNSRPAGTVYVAVQLDDSISDLRTTAQARH